MPLPEPVEDLIEVAAKASLDWWNIPALAAMVSRPRHILEAVNDDPRWSIVRTDPNITAGKVDHTPHDSIFSGVYEFWRDDENPSNTPACQADGVERALARDGFTVVRTEEIEALRDAVRDMGE